MHPRVSRTHLTLAAGAALLLPALAGCVPARPADPARSSATTAASAPAPAAQAQEVRLTVREWSFQPAALNLTAGRPVTVVLENRGNIEHDIAIPALNFKLAALAGKTTSATLTPSREGTFEFVCSLPGHKEAGMKGSVQVAAGTPGAAPASAPAQTEDAALATSAARASAQSQHTSHAAVATTATRGNQELGYRLDGTTKVYDVTAQHVRWEVLPGEFLDAYAYNGQIPGPVIRVTEGDRLRINLRNELPEPTVIHPHGPSIPNSMDGVPDVTQKVVQPGGSFAYEFVAKAPGVNMYHTHHNSAEQEPKGLYGLLIVEPKTPTVVYDRELLQVLGESGGYYLINGKAFPATEAIEIKKGQKLLIRLVNLGQMPHPMHLHGHPFKIVATDGHPVPPAAQLTKDTVTLGPGERVDLLVEAEEPGTWVFHCHILSHVQNHGVEPGGMITVVKVNE